jgi:hypothetical protein
MNKRYVLPLFLIFLFVSVAGAIGFVLVTKQETPVKTEKTTSEESLPSTDNTSSNNVEASKTYTDSSGFSFGYPNGFVATDVTPDDPTFYSKVSVSNSTDVVTVSLFDTKAKTIAAWISQGPYKATTLSGAIPFGTLTASQYKDSSSLLTVALKDGILYLIESKNTPSLDQIHTLIASSFSQGATQSSSSSTSSSAPAADEVIEPEEVVE